MQGSLFKFSFSQFWIDKRYIFWLKEGTAVHRSTTHGRRRNGAAGTSFQEHMPRWESMHCPSRQLSSNRVSPWRSDDVIALWPVDTWADYGRLGGGSPSSYLGLLLGWLMNTTWYNHGRSNNPCNSGCNPYHSVNINPTLLAEDLQFKAQKFLSIAPASELQSVAVASQHTLGSLWRQLAAQPLKFCIVGQ